MADRINWDDCPTGAAVQAKLDAIHDDVKEIKADVKKQNGRIRKLEDWRTGIVAIGGFIILIVGIIKFFL